MITVLLAAWNGEAYIEEQLDSILGQTECGKLRILVSDDGSEDGTEAILARYLARYPEQMELVSRPHARKRQDAESGIPAAAGNFFWLFEQALEKERDAEGDYYMLSDQDDVWKPNKAERLMTEMKRLEEKLGADHPILVHSDMAVTDADRNVIHPSFFRYQNCDPMRVTFSELLVENSVTGGAVLMNRSLLELAGRRPAACYMHDWWIALTASCFGTISWVNEALYEYRQHGNNTLGAKKAGSVRDMTERLDRASQVEENYRKMAAQAHAFGKQYQEMMSEEQKAVLRAYLALRYQSPAGRLRNIWRNRFFKSSRLQTLAQCVTIPRPDGENRPV